MVAECSDNRIVMPGDVIRDADVAAASVENKVILGPGLKRMGEEVVACRGGVLRRKEGAAWVEAPQRRYAARRGEDVIGIVVKKQGDYFKLDIGGPEPAQLYFLAFENASKKNRPDLSAGDVVMCRLVTAHPAMEPEVVCCDSAGRSAGLGCLLGPGMLFSCSLHLARRLLHPSSRLVACLGTVFPKFELSVGLNGRLWVCASSPQTILELADALLSAENVPLDQMNDYCRQVLIKFKNRRERASR